MMHFRIGLAAHDLAGALGAPEVVLSRAERDAGGPAIASRFWLRVQALLGEDLLPRHTDTRIPELARLLDASGHEPPHPRPRPLPSPEQRQVRISVTDECGGIRPEDLARVFEPGWRGTQARSPARGEGAGLGLAVVRGVAEAHGGRVGVRNEGGGCRFDVSLPVARAP